jgi:PAS domain S-box-containing protein
VVKRSGGSRSASHTGIGHRSGLTHTSPADGPLMATTAATVPPAILLVEDNPGDVDLVREILPASWAAALTHRDHLVDAVAYVTAREADCILLDLSLPDAAGLDAVVAIREVAPTAALVVLTGSDDEQLAMEAMQAGAQDYLVKGDIDGHGMARAIRYAIERKRAEIDRRSGEELLRHAFDDAPIGVAMMSFDGTCLRANRVLAEMLRQSPEELVGADARVWLCPEHLRPSADRWQYESELPRRGTVALAVDVSGSLVRDLLGRPLYWVVHVQDVSARKRAEQMKNEFFALVSHELRTPLTSIVGYTAVLREDLDADLIGRSAARHLSVVARNAHRLQRLVGDLLFVAQLEADNLGLQKSQIDLSQVAKDSCEAGAPRAAELGVTVRVETVPAPIFGDADRLGQLIDNLLSNALKFTPAGGTVEVAVGLSDGAARLVVCDTGIGIADGELAQLFDRFFRASTARGRAIPGVGLGLSIVKALAEGHGGAVSVESTEGVGTKFVVTLPLREPSR